MEVALAGVGADLDCEVPKRRIEVDTLLLSVTSAADAVEVVAVWLLRCPSF